MKRNTSWVGVIATAGLDMRYVVCLKHEVFPRHIRLLSGTFSLGQIDKSISTR